MDKPARLMPAPSPGLPESGLAGALPLFPLLPTSRDRSRRTFFCQRRKGFMAEEAHLRHFITGGAGFIGSHLVDALLSEGAEVVVYDSLRAGRREWLHPHRENPHFHFVLGDLLDLEKLSAAMARSDVVWHFGANTDMVIGRTQTEVDVRDGILATRHVLEAMRQNGVKELLFPSSGAIYGDIANPPATEEYGPLLPVSLYGAAKLAAEALISAYCHLFEMKACLFRFGNVIGHRMSHGIICDVVEKLRGNPHELEILGDGQGEKNYFLVEDCVDGMRFAHRHAHLDTDCPCAIFNLGSRSTTKVETIAQIVIEEMGLRNVRLQYTGGKRGWPGDQPRVYMDVNKMLKLGWAASVTSTEAVRIATRRYLGKETGAPSQPAKARPAAAGKQTGGNP